MLSEESVDLLIQEGQLEIIQVVISKASELGCAGDQETKSLACPL